MLSLVVSISREDDFQLFAKVLASAAFADEIVIYSMNIDSAKLAPYLKPYSVKLIPLTFTKPTIVEEFRDRQVRQTKGDWVLVLDSDEIVSPKLKQEIISLITQTPPKEVGAYALPRQNYSLGYRIRHGGWNDDYQVRLIRKTAFIEWPNIIHVVPKIRGKIVKLNSPLRHYKDPSLSFIINKTNRYSDAEADLFFKGGLPLVTPFTLFRKMNMEIFRRAILKLGLLDGAIGVIQSIYQGFSVFITYAKLYEKQLNDKNCKPGL